MSRKETKCLKENKIIKKILQVSYYNINDHKNVSFMKKAVMKLQKNTFEKNPEQPLESLS